MLKNFLFEKSSAQYYDKMIIIDTCGLEYKLDFAKIFEEHGYEVILYTDDISFRINYEEKTKRYNSKYVIIAKENQYIPFDIRKESYIWELSYSNIFPKLNHQQVKKMSAIELDLLSIAYPKLYEDIHSVDKTSSFIKTTVFAEENIGVYLDIKYSELKEKLFSKPDAINWLKIAREKAEIDILAIKHKIFFDTSEVNLFFKEFILQDFGKLSQVLSKDSPVLINNVMEYVVEHSKRFVIIVMDGMSEFDWEIISKEFEKIKYQKSSVFAMIPTTTSISRQCLLANKYPSQLVNPWSQNKEKLELLTCADRLGFDESQTGYERGYDSDFNFSVDCGVVIINEIDDLVHSQQQGKEGMYQDIELLSKENKLRDMVKRFIKSGYDVYITSDHGNSQAEGMGKLMKTGVEIETKSKKMLVLKEIADKQALISKYGMIDYPKYYLDKKYDYLICDVNTSLDAFGSNVITHGGISIDEVIVPFVIIKSEENNG